MSHIPPEAQASHIAVVGTTGSGKTYTGIGLVGGFLEAGKRVCIIDPTGVWWGLRSSADGNGPGFPVVIFGGEHADVAIAETSGAAVAQLIASRNLPAIIDLSEMLQDAQIKFVLDFAMTIYAANKMPLHLVIDEADEFAPQNPMAEAKRVLHHVQRIARRGRVKGFRLLLITQRPAVLHKNVLSQAQTLVVMKLTAPQDRAAIGAWIEGQADAAKGKEVLDSLPQLNTGEGWVWAPAQDALMRTQFPKNRTFDSSRSPEDGEIIETPSTLADVDVTAIRESIAPPASDEDASPSRGKRTRGAAASPEELAAAEQRGYERGRGAGRAEGYNTALEHARTAVGGLIPMQTEDSSEANRRVDEMRNSAIRGTDPAPAPRATAGKGDGTITDKAQRTFLTVLAQHKRRLTRNQIAIFAGYSSKSSHVDNTISRLRVLGYVVGGRDGIEITADGRKALGKYEPLPTGRELQAYWIRELDGAGAKFLTIICAAHPRAMTRDQVAEKAGYSTSSSHVDNTLSSLRTRGLITGGRDALKASEELFG